MILLFVISGLCIHTWRTHNRSTKHAIARCLTNWLLRCLTADTAVEDETGAGFLACLCS